MRRTALLFVCALSALMLVSAFAPPPVFEHKADRNVKGTKCEVCQALVKELLIKLPTLQAEPDLSTAKLRRAREQKVSDVVDNICNVENFKRYEFAPPVMLPTCNAFVSDYGEEIESMLYKGVTSDLDMRTKLCLKTKWCDKLWSAEQEEQKRNKSPEELKQEAEERRAKALEEEKQKKAEEKKKKAEKKKQEQEDKKKKEAEATTGEAAAEAATTASEENKKDEL